LGGDVIAEIIAGAPASGSRDCNSVIRDIRRDGNVAASDQIDISILWRNIVETLDKITGRWK
jgi:hypothetical protein